ncbi:MAG TPA: hypothetical protein VMW67_03095 [Desulfobacteria bacterium]|nr:hypothetical protein [Desulfobacteria bacterium]
MGSVLVNDNNITSDDEGIHVSDFYEFGYRMYGTSSFTMGNVEFCRNDINASGYGMNFGDMPNYFGEQLDDNASVVMGGILFNENRINSTDDGIYCEGYLGNFGYDMDGNATFEMGNVEFNSNRIDSKGGDGMYWRRLRSLAIRCITMLR